MAEMWFYTREGRQMDAVTIDELKRLVTDGSLKRTDMVWKDGMPRWLRAGTFKDLYPDSAPGSQQSPPSNNGEETFRPRSRSRPSRDEDDGRSSRRRAASSSAASNLGIVLAVVIGGGVVLIFLVGGVFILVLGSRGNPIAGNAKVPPLQDFVNAVPDDPVNVKKDDPLPAIKKGLPLGPAALKGDGTILKELLPGQQHEFKWRVKAGVNASVVAITASGTRGADLKIVVFKDREDTELNTNVREGVNPGITFSLPTSEIVRVIVRNVSKAATIRCTIAYNGGI